MKIIKILFVLGMARSNAEARRLVIQGSVLIGGCINGCNPRMGPNFKCICKNWIKITDPDMHILPGRVLRIKDGSWRLVKREGKDGFDQLLGIGCVQ